MRVCMYVLICSCVYVYMLCATSETYLLDLQLCCNKSPLILSHKLVFRHITMFTGQCLIQQCCAQNTYHFDDEQGGERRDVDSFYAEVERVKQ